MSELQLLLIVELPLLGLLVYMIVDVVRRSDLSFARKLAWTVSMVFVPVVMLAFYIVVRPPRSARFVGGDADLSRAESFVLLAESRQRGELTDDQYRAEAETIVSVS